MKTERTTIICLFLVFLVDAAPTDEAEEEDPTMLSYSSDLKVMVNDSVILPCKVRNIGKNVRVWKQEPSNLLFSGNIAVSRNAKISLMDDSSLQILRITPEYAGVYICQVGRHPSVNVVHKIQVLVPPSVTLDVPEGKMVARKGDSTSFRCIANGIPKPQVTWTYGDEKEQESPLPNGVRQTHGGELQISSVDVLHAGIYRCLAKNDVGAPVSTLFSLTVRYAPEVLVKPEWAHGDKGYSAEFVCTCRSVPPSQVVWLRGDHKQGKTIQESDRVRLKHTSIRSGVRLALKLQIMRKEDLGSYTCMATNSVGETWRTVELSGLAEPVQLRGSESGETSYFLKWSAKSYSPIIEYQLKIRKHKSGDQWTDVVIPSAAEGPPQTFLYSQSYNVTGIEPGVRYEAVLQAHNDFGWNRPSETLYFSAGTPPPSEMEVTGEEPTLFPVYEAEVEVTGTSYDPTYLKQDSAADVSRVDWFLFLSHLLFFMYL